jgi:uncharacterized protein (TIGR03066 family)
MRFILLFIISLSFIACQSNQNMDITGSWTTTSTQDNTGMNITDKVDFNTDGSYVLTLYSNGDSLVSEMKGSYQIDKNKQTLSITTSGANFKHKIINFDKDYLKIKTSQGVEMSMKRIQ